NQSVSVDPFHPRLENAGAHFARNRCSLRLSNRPQKRAMTSARSNAHRALMQKQPQLSSRPTTDHRFTFPVSPDSVKVVVAILLIAAMPVYAQARSAGKVSKGDGVPNWDVSSSCRAAAKVAYTENASEREKSCMESENRTREKLAADWSTFPAEE